MALPLNHPTELHYHRAAGKTNPFRMDQCPADDEQIDSNRLTTVRRSFFKTKNESKKNRHTRTQHTQRYAIGLEDGAGVIRWKYSAGVLRSMLVGDVEPQIEGKREKKLFSNGLGQFFSRRGK
jgi:hypothetical protein